MTERKFLRSASNLLFVFLITIASVQAANTTPKTDTEMTADVKEIMRSIDEVKRLPVTGLSFIKAGDKSFLITDNGHFVVAGNFKLVDI